MKKPKISLSTKGTAMKQFLVVLRHTMDDLPLQLFDHKDEAIAFAETVDEMPTDRIRKIIGTDCSSPVGCDVYEFRDGELVQVHNVTDFE